MPGGAFDRNAAGELIEGSFHAVPGGIPFWKWMLSPLLVLTVSGNATLIAVVAFLLVISGVFNALGLADVSYSKWFRWSIRFQLCNLVLTAALLLLGLAVGYGL